MAQLYRLRKSRTYRKRRVAYQPTRPTPVAIGERRRPEPQGRPGYLRVDTVHQGDLDGAKGLYHINAVDEVTQWQVVGATAQISEAWLLPVLEGMLEQFPFRIRGFHSDNGSEFINKDVAKLLNKLLAEQTKSRPRHSNDNGLAESKNGWVIRKHIGYGHIASAHAEAFDRFYRQHFNPYLNFHRPSGSLARRRRESRASPPVTAVEWSNGCIGRSAEAGVRMAQLASREFLGPPFGIDSRFGLLEVFGGVGAKPEKLTANLWDKAGPCSMFGSRSIRSADGSSRLRSCSSKREGRNLWRRVR